MNDMEYIEKRLDAQQAWHSQKSRRYQNMHQWLRFIELILSSSIPVATTFYWGTLYGKWIIVIIGFLLTILAAAQNIWHFQKRGLDYRSVSEALKREKFLYLTHTSPYSDDTGRFSSLVEHVEAILASQNKSWIAMSRVSHKE